MILLKTLLHEISMDTVKPYTTDFVWHGPEDFWYQDGDTYTSEIDCDGHPVMLHMEYNEHTTPQELRGVEPGVWSFSFFVRSAQRNSWTVQQDNGAIKGTINTLRLFKTIGLGLQDFVASHHSIDVIDITGADRTDAKGEQKSRVYIGFLESNPLSTGLDTYRVARYGSQVYLVRQRVLPQVPQPDASGIDTPNDPNM